MRGRAREFHGVLTSTFAQRISDISVGWLGAIMLPAELVIHSAIPSVTATVTTATLPIELDDSRGARN